MNASEAACEGFDTNFFFEDYEDNDQIAMLVDNLCMGCPMIQECLTLGIENDSWGVFGGYYLVDGKISRSMNRHKTKKDWQDLEQLHVR